MDTLIEAKDLLVGRTIDRVRRLSIQEMENFMWYKNPVVLVLDDGSQVVLQCDDEGNDGGAALVYTKKEESFTLYTI